METATKIIKFTLLNVRNHVYLVEKIFMRNKKQLRLTQEENR